MRKSRGIFSKLVSVFLFVGLLPFLLVSVWTYNKAKDGMTEAVIQYWLVRQARETAARLEQEVDDIRALIRSWADDNALEATLAELSAGERTADLLEFVTSFLERRRKYRPDLDLLLLVDGEGNIVAQSVKPRDPDVFEVARLAGRRLDEILPGIEDRSWIELSLNPREDAIAQAAVPVTTRDWHISPLVASARGEPAWDGARSGYPADPAAYALGFAGTIRSHDRNRTVGTLIAVFNWSRIQGLLDDVTKRFREPDDPKGATTRYSSGYPFLFARDLDTVIGHEHRENLGTSLSKDHRLPGFRERMTESRYGSYFYEYREGAKISGYARTKDVEEEGFGWTVGVGINSPEIYRDVKTLRDFVVVAGLLLTGLVVLLAALFSHRLTVPIRRLIDYTRELSRGRLDARVKIDTRDEIAVLADSFNRMAEDLQESNRRLIEAEKEAAWSEMARQVAHEIKNPLTPIMLSAQQLARAHKDRHPDFDQLLEESVGTIIGQCEDLKRIAADFASFSRFSQSDAKPCKLRPLLEQILELYRPRVTRGLDVRSDLSIPADIEVSVDEDRFRRMLLNLFNNALEAMEEGGALTLSARVASSGSHVEIRVSDTGRGIPQEARHRLFEPYFSTRTGGTGLGLAIVKRIVDEARGTISLESELGKGTTFIVTLPLAPSP